MWPFKRKPKASPPSKPEPRDRRNWNENWCVGDTAECIIQFNDWHPSVKPWHRPAFGAQFKVIGFRDGISRDANLLLYGLILEGWPSCMETTAFRKVSPVASEESEVVQRILNAKPGVDRTREDA